MTEPLTDPIGAETTVPKDHARPVQSMLAELKRSIHGDTVSVAHLLRSMDPSAQFVLLLIPALILVSPLSGIPGMATLGGLTIASVAGQLLFGRARIWLPGFVLHREMSAGRLSKALNWLGWLARLIDRVAAPRMAWVLVFPGRQIALATCMACGLTMPFLELVPFSATILASVVVLLSVALMVRDGALAAVGLGGLGLAVMTIAKLIGD